PDDIMYLIPAVLIATWRWRSDGTPRAEIVPALCGGALAILVALTPFFAYNWIATGNPFWPTQGMELTMLLRPASEVQSDAPPESEPTPAPAPTPSDDGKVGYPSQGWHGGSFVQVQGGGLRVANLPRTLPGLLDLLRRGYGPPFLGLAVWGITLALVQR